MFEHEQFLFLVLVNPEPHRSENFKILLSTQVLYLFNETFEGFCPWRQTFSNFLIWDHKVENVNKTAPLTV